jgi:putative transcriptional regulator
MRKKDFDNLVTSIRQAGRIRRGEMKPSRVTRFAPPDIRAVRLRLHQSQAEFARMIGVSIASRARRGSPDPAATCRQGRRRPEGPARALLKVAAVNPQAVADARRILF